MSCRETVVPVVSARASLLLPAKTDCSCVRDKDCDWLAMLLALTGACRGSELKSLKVSLMQDKGTDIWFRVDALTKTKMPSKPRPLISIGAMNPLIKTLDPSVLLKKYSNMPDGKT